MFPPHLPRSAASAWCGLAAAWHRRAFWAWLLVVLSQLPAAITEADELVRVSGEVTYREKSGRGVYLELRTAQGTVGVELSAAAARSLGRRLQVGASVSARGRRVRGDKEVRFVVEVEDAGGVKLDDVVASHPRAALVPVRLRPDPPPTVSVEMLAASGAWPPQDSDDVAALIARARREAVGRLILDSGLTELRRAYRQPQPFYEVISKLSAEAKRQGLPTAFYLPAFEIRKDREDRSPERLQSCCQSWAQMTFDGKPYIKTRFEKDEFWNRSGDEALWACPLSPWRREFLARVREAARRGADLIFLDAPYFHGGEHPTCRCSRCQARFTKDTGLAIPAQVARGTVAYQRWLAWRGQMLADFFAEVRRTIRHVNPRARLAVEEFPSALVGGTVDTGLDPGRIGAQSVDLFVHEHSAKQFDKKPYSPKERLEQAVALAIYRGLDGDRPTWVLSYAHDPVASRVSAGLQLAYDASFWETKGPEMNDASVSRTWRQQLFGWFSKHREAFGSSRPIAEVAVLYSAAARDAVADHFPQLQKVLRVLVEAGVPFAVVPTRDLHELRHYRTLILPSLAALSDSEARALRQGGHQLLAVGQPPERDALGLRGFDPRLRLQRIKLESLLGQLGPQPVRVQGGRAVVNLLQRRKEIQLRLASLEASPVRLTVQLRAPGFRSATSLALLGDEQPLSVRRSGDQLEASFTVSDLLLLRLRLR